MGESPGWGGKWAPFRWAQEKGATGWVHVWGWRGRFGREGSPEEGDGPGWRKGVKDGRRPNFRAGARWQGWRRGPVGADGAPRGPETGCPGGGGEKEASGAAEGGWGRGACAGPLPVLGVYHPRWLCSGWEEAARGVGRWTSGWVWGRARGPVSAG